MANRKLRHADISARAHSDCRISTVLLGTNNSVLQWFTFFLETVRPYDTSKKMSFCKPEMTSCLCIHQGALCVVHIIGFRNSDTEIVILFYSNFTSISYCFWVKKFKMSSNNKTYLQTWNNVTLIYVPEDAVCSSRRRILKGWPWLP